MYVANAVEETDDDVRSVANIDIIVYKNCKKALRCSRFFVSRMMRAMCERSRNMSMQSPQSRFVDSESWILAIKLFSCLTAREADQRSPNPLSRRIAGTDSRPMHSSVRVRNTAANAV